MPLPAHDGPAVPRYLFARQQTEETVEERLRTRRETVKEERWQCQQVFARREARRLDQLGKVAAEAKAMTTGVIVGKPGADEVAVEDRPPGLAIEKCDGEAPIEAVHDQLVRF